MSLLVFYTFGAIKFSHEYFEEDERENNAFQLSVKWDKTALDSMEQSEVTKVSANKIKVLEAADFEIAVELGRLKGTVTEVSDQKVCKVTINSAATAYQNFSAKIKEKYFRDALDSINQQIQGIQDIMIFDGAVRDRNNKFELSINSPDDNLTAEIRLKGCASIELTVHRLVLI